jgi:hypothetical protein
MGAVMGRVDHSEARGYRTLVSSMESRGILMSPAILSFVLVALLSADPVQKGQVPPAIEFGVKDGQIEVRWQSNEFKCIATAPQMVIKDCVLLLSGTDKKPVEVQTFGSGKRAIIKDGDKVVAVEPPSAGGKPDEVEVKDKITLDPKTKFGISLADGKVKIISP